MKYIKKDEFKNTRHCFRSEFGEEIVIVNDVMKNDYVYEKNKFMFDVVEEENEIEEIIVPVIEEENEIPVIEEKLIVEEKEEVVGEDPSELILEELRECSTINQILELASEHNLDLDGRIKNVMKLRENFKEELEMRI